LGHWVYHIEIGSLLLITASVHRQGWNPLIFAAKTIKNPIPSTQLCQDEAFRNVGGPDFQNPKAKAALRLYQERSFVALPGEDEVFRPSSGNC
jgi:hypothetical protein